MADEIRNIVKRVQLAYTVLFCMVFFIIGFIIYVQYVDPPEKESGISVKSEKIEARRGSILSEDGRPLAMSIPYYQIRMDCMAPNKDTFANNVSALARELSELFGNKSAQTYRNELLKYRKEGKRYQILGNRTVDYSELERIKRFPILKYGANRGGLIVEEKSKRNNPYGRLAYRTIGYINTLGVGVGIEESYDYYLKGKAGNQMIQKIVGGEWIPVNMHEVTEPEDGMDVRTTIDIEIQEAAEDAIRNQLSRSDVFEGATAMVMEVKSGAIRAIVNMKKMKNGTFDESFNYAIGQPSEPGSTFKLVTLISLLEDGHVTLESPIDVGNGRWQYSTHTYVDVGRGLGLIDVKEAFAKSSNVAFTKMAVQYYGNNEKAFVDRIINMKVTDKLNLDIKANGTTRMLYPGETGWNKLTLPSMAIGYAIDITPLHTLTFYNAVANDGVMMKPYFIQSLEKDGKVVEYFDPTIITGSICSKSTIKEAKRALRYMVERGNKAYNDPRYQIAGKTGTARILLENGRYSDSEGYRRHQASFAGFFPADNPKYSAIVVMYTGKTKANFYGGAWAMPAFKEIADRIYATRFEWKEPVDGSRTSPSDNPVICGGNVKAERMALSMLRMSDKPVLPDDGWVKFVSDSTSVKCITIETEDGHVPDVSGMGLKDALFLLENEGYKIRFSGYGKVVSQNPEAGCELKRKSTVNIVLEPDIEKKNRNEKK